MKTAGLAAAAGLLAQQIIKKDDEKRAFHDKLEGALFENELKMGRIRPTKKGESPTTSYGGIGFNAVSPEEASAEAAAKLKQANSLIPEGVSGSYLPDIPGMKFQSDRTSSKDMMNRERAIKIQNTDRYQFLPEQSKAYVDHVASGGDPAKFTSTPPPAPSPATADAGAGRQWGQGVLDFGRAVKHGLGGGTKAPQLATDTLHLVQLPDGSIGTIPESKLQEALKRGAKLLQ